MLRFSEGTNASENPSSLVDDLFRDSFFHVVILQTFVKCLFPARGGANCWRCKVK